VTRGSYVHNIWRKRVSNEPKTSFKRTQRIRSGNKTIMHLYAYVSTYTIACLHIHIHMHTPSHTPTHTQTHTRTHTLTYTHTYTGIYVWVCVRALTRGSACAYAYATVRTFTLTIIHTPQKAFQEV